MPLVVARKVLEKTLEVFVVVGTTSSSVLNMVLNKSKENSAILLIDNEVREVVTKVIKIIWVLTQAEIQENVIVVIGTITKVVDVRYINEIMVMHCTNKRGQFNSSTNSLIKSAPEYSGVLIWHWVTRKIHFKMVYIRSWRGGCKKTARRNSQFSGSLQLC